MDVKNEFLNGINIKRTSWMKLAGITIVTFVCISKNVRHIIESILRNINGRSFN